MSVARWAGLALATGAGVRLLRGRLGPSLEGKTVLVTGGSRGLGLLLARRFAREGCRVAVCARDEVALEGAREDLEARGARVLARRCDVRDADEVEALVAGVERRFGRLDILVNNAGIIQAGPLGALTREDFEEALAANFFGTLYPTLAALPRMLARGEGRVVNIASIGGRVPIPHLLPYSCGKFAQVGFSEGLRAELAGTGVDVTTVVPGLMRTGSPPNALFKGRKEREMAWFYLGSSTPLTSMSAERAARRIVEAARRGRATVTLSWQAKLLGLAHDLAPTPTQALLGAVGRLLPGAPRGGDPAAERGMELTHPLAPSPLTRLTDRAARRNNEYGGAPRPSPEHARAAGLEDGARAGRGRAREGTCA